MKPLHLVLCALLLAAIGCENKSSNAQSERVSDNPFGIAQWDYTNKDEAGEAVTKGLLTLPSPLPVGKTFYGTWQARYVGKIGEEGKVGPQINGGKMAGDYSAEGQLTLRLNPNMIDNNVTLTGTVSGDSIKGTWQFSGIAGPTASGTFEATPAK